MIPASEQYVCSNCGEIVEELDDFTGWCSVCTPSSISTLIDTTEWLLKNADHIEFYLALGNSITTSIDLVYRDLRPKCLVCGNTITHASSGRGVVFCRRTKVCRRYARRYTYLYQNKGLTKPEALAQVVRELE